MRKHAGFTIVELLVAAALLTIVLGIVATYFAQQVRLTRTTQAQSEVQDTARMVMQIVANDILAAGANQHVTGSTIVAVPTPAPLTVVDNGVVDAVTGISYVTSLRDLAAACRTVTYSSSGSELRRGDNVCNAATPAAAQALAEGVLAFDLEFVCSDAPTAPEAEPDACTAVGRNAYVRSVRVNLLVRSTAPRGVAKEAVTYVSPLDATATVTCPAQFACARLSQEILTPNLKDN